VTPTLAAELSSLVVRLRECAAKGDKTAIAGPLAALEAAAEKLGKSWSGSNMGYQTRVYYEGFDVPPPGAHFSSEWGFIGMFQGTTGDWREYQADEVVSLIHETADVEAITEAAAEAARKVWRTARSEVVSVFHAFLSSREDPLVREFLKEAEGVRDLSISEAERALIGPIGTRMTRDTTALSQGFMAAPHQQVIARVISIRSAFGACEALADIAERGAAHFQRLQASQISPREVPAGVRRDATSPKHSRIASPDPPLETSSRSDTQEPSRQPTVFLCHASEDKQYVRVLDRRLRNDGIGTWLDERDLLPGREWDTAIRQAVLEADVVVVCLSSDSVNKTGYVQKEIGHVLDVAEEQPEGAIFVIPAKIGPCEVPNRLSRWQWVDLRKRGGYNRLVAAIRAPRA
jgi:hypothetical protein